MILGLGRGFWLGKSRVEALFYQATPSILRHLNCWQEGNISTTRSAVSNSGQNFWIAKRSKTLRLEYQKYLHQNLQPPEMGKDQSSHKWSLRNHLRKEWTVYYCKFQHDLHTRGRNERKCGCYWVWRGGVLLSEPQFGVPGVLLVFRLFFVWLYGLNIR